MKRLGSVFPVCFSWLIWSALQSAWKHGNISHFYLQPVFDQFFSSFFLYIMIYHLSCNLNKYRVFAHQILICAKVLILNLALECHKLRNWRCPSREKKRKKIVLPCAMAVFTLVAHKMFLLRNVYHRKVNRSLLSQLVRGPLGWSLWPDLL